MSFTEIDRKTLKHGDIVWACAFDIDVDRYNQSSDIKHLYCKPVKGIVVENLDAHWYDLKFAITSKDGTPRKSGRVSLNARRFTYTYEDCVELFNSIIEEKIQYLNGKISELEEMKIAK